MRVAVLKGGRSLERVVSLSSGARVEDALGENVAFVPGQAAFVDGRGSSSMRLNFSAQTEEEITEGVRRIGRVISEQVDLYRTITGEHRVAPAPAEPEQGGGQVLPLRPRRRETRDS